MQPSSWMQAFVAQLLDAGVDVVHAQVVDHNVGGDVVADNDHQGGNIFNGQNSTDLQGTQNAAAVDPYSEQIIREILCCYAAMGYPNKAKARYDEYCALIGEELGIEPSKWLKREFLACFSENRL